MVISILISNDPQRKKQTERERERVRGEEGRRNRKEELSHVRKNETNFFSRSTKFV